MEATILSAGHREAAVSALTEAFWDYPEAVHLLPEESRRRRVLPAYLRGDCEDSLSYRCLLGSVVDDEVVAAAAWLPPEAYPIPIGRQLAQVRYFLPVLPWGFGAAQEARRGQQANRARHPRQAHFYLRSVGVKPDWQRRGAGSCLIEPILARADEDEVGCYLTTAAFANVAFYQRFGFDVLADYHPTPAWPQVWAMWRDPR